MNPLKNRRTELDILRLLATLAVIATHLVAGILKSSDVNSSFFVQLNTLRSAITWDVPVFVMISGCLFLRPEKDITLKSIYGKYIRHLVTCFVAWSAVFQIFHSVVGGSNLNFKGILSEFLIGPYPFWYLFMLIGLYMIVPFLRTFSSDRKLVGYFLLLFLGGEFVANYGVALPGLGSVVEQIFAKSQFHFALGFTGYYLLGHYLMNTQFSPKKEAVLYTAGIICLIFTCLATTWQSRAQGVYNEWFSKYLMPNVIIESAALFVFFSKRVGKIPFSDRTRTVFATLSTLGLGVYLIHAIILEVMGHIGLTVQLFSPLPATLILTAIAYIISLGLTWLIRKIPYIGKQIT